MRNRAKCLVCNQVIEGTQDKEVYCLCKSLSLYGSQKETGRIAYYDIKEFVYIDDDGKESLVKEKESKENIEIGQKPSKQEMLKMLRLMIEEDEALPTNIKTLAVNYYDLMRYMLIIEAILNEG